MSQTSAFDGDGRTQPDQRAGRLHRVHLEDSRSWAGVFHGSWQELRADSHRIDDSPSSNRRQLGDAASVQAVTAALVGDDRIARSAAVRAETLDPIAPWVTIGAWTARAITWMANGEAGSAHSTLADLFERHPAAAWHAGIAGLFAESAVLAHRESDARRTLGRRPAGVTLDSATQQEVVLAEALLHPTAPGTALEMMLGTSSAHAPFVRARAHLSLGRWLRRNHRSADARRHIQVALDHLLALDAQPWVRMARSELRAGGVRQPPDAGGSLSEQQLRIAALAARGMHNREIADRLYLSPRTVGSHLYRLYPKLGITSRHQLGAALAALASSLKPDAD